MAMLRGTQIILFSDKRRILGEAFQTLKRGIRERKKKEDA